MPKYFVAPENIFNGAITMSGENAAYLIVVLRVRPGAKITVCDGKKTDYDCEITAVTGRDSLEMKILSRAPAPEPRLDVTLYQSLPKSDKMEHVIQKCVELGVSRIAPVYTKNSPVDRLTDAKLHCYKKISEASARQCMRGIIPVISPFTLEQAAADASRLSLAFAMYENERFTSLKSFLNDNPLARFESVGFFIGPDGGFTPEEAAMIKRAGIPTVSLGSRVLKTETAGPAVLSILMYETDELGSKIWRGYS